MICSVFYVPCMLWRSYIYGNIAKHIFCKHQFSREKLTENEIIYFLHYFVGSWIGRHNRRNLWERSIRGVIFNLWSHIFIYRRFTLFISNKKSIVSKYSENRTIEGLKKEVDYNDDVDPLTYIKHPINAYNLLVRCSKWFPKVFHADQILHKIFSDPKCTL